jgi:glycosyltransferase involved in cell wall biosynthesis
MNYELSIVIPSRNEMFLKNTVDDIVKQKRGKTEVIVVLDGQWTDPPLDDHEDVRIIYVPESIGQRAAQNLGVKLSRAKYVAKTDAHCAFDEGFDVKLMETMEDDMTMVPVMRNLHIFNWVCEHCGLAIYQGPKPEKCRSEECSFDDQKFRMEIVWNPKTNPQSSAYRFNKNLQFKYFPELRERQPKTGLAETMSLQGSFFMCTREKYWSLGLCDESWGSWGQQGTEVAIKTWLSGGRVLCNRDTWYAHLFRTQSGFDHPFPIGNSQQNARKISRDIFLNNRWDKAIRPLSWILERFWKELQEVRDPEALWEPKDLDALKNVPLNKAPVLPKGPSKGILFYTTNKLPVRFAKKVQRNLQQMGLPITSVSLKPMPNFGNNIHIPLEPGKWAYFTQILVGLETMKEDIIFMVEHDCVYPKEHFDFTPPEKDTFYYNQSWWKIREDGFAVHWDAEQVSGLVAYRELLVNYYRGKIEEIVQKGFNRSYEPKTKYEVWKSAVPYLDIRQPGTLTKDKWSLNDFRTPPVNWQESTKDKIEGWKSDILK